MVQSPKKGFNALIYLHRYNRDTMNVVLNQYLRPYHEKLRARKQADKLSKILKESEEWERDTLLPLAQARIELDLDDGVKVNYRKLGEALAPVS